MEWLYLALAIACEVAATTCMKLSDGFGKPLYAALMAVGYGLCFALLTLALKRIDIGTAYAIWSGAGTVLIVAVGIVLFRDPVTVLKLGSIALIVAGVVGLRLSGGAG